jgi:hypothetical protein
MPDDWNVASASAVALVAAMTDRFDGDSYGPPGGPVRHVPDRQCVVRIGQMITESTFDGVVGESFAGALGLLAARAVEELSISSGEPIETWLERWLDEPYGSPTA